jgi:hypothetical protein
MRFKCKLYMTYKEFVFRKEVTRVLLLSSLRDKAYRIVIKSALYD